MERSLCVGGRIFAVSSTQTDDLEAMEVESEQVDSEPEADKIARYRTSPLEECSDTELWFRLHHHDDDPEDVFLHNSSIEANLEELNASRMRAVDSLLERAENAQIRGEHEYAENLLEQANIINL